MPNNPETFEYYNIEQHPKNTNDLPDIKNQYSTFMEELEDSTEKLMDQVFNTDYKPEISPSDQQLLNENKAKYRQKYFRNLATNHLHSSQFQGQYQENMRGDFEAFIKRNRKWRQKKNTNIEMSRARVIQQQDKQLTFIPKILRGSKEKLQPIYERCLQLHSSKEKTLALKRIQQKRTQQAKVNCLSFQPEVNPNCKTTRTFKDYIRDKQQWNNKKMEKREFKKLKQKAKECIGCTFSPQLISKQSKQPRNQERVEIRMLREFQQRYQIQR